MLKPGLSQILPRRTFVFLLCLALTVELTARAQPPSWSQRAANAAMAHWPAGSSDHAVGEFGLLLNGMGTLWYSTADGTYYSYEQQQVAAFLAAKGSIDPRSSMTMARAVLLVGLVTQDARYFQAAAVLDQGLSSEPQKSIPRDDPRDIYDSAPFYAQYAQSLQKQVDFKKIAQRFAEDERGKGIPAGEIAGSRIFDARAMGWFVAALVDTLPSYPHDDPDRRLLLRILHRATEKAVRAQDSSTGLWRNSSDESDRMDDAITTCMFTYALQKGARLGYLKESYSQIAMRAWRGTLARLVTAEGPSLAFARSKTNDGAAHTVTGDGGPEEVGAFLLASTEMERAQHVTAARDQLVMLDSWFNSQQRVNAAGYKEYFHYKWSDYSDSGYSLLGSIFAGSGADLATLPVAPTLENLRRAEYYIIVSPDIPAKNPTPHYVQVKDADEVVRWVGQGGILMLMENDPPNADIEHLNLIADRFGMHFDPILRHHVIGDNYAAGKIAVDGAGPIFRHPHTLYMKDTCSLSLRAPATPLLVDRGEIVIAMARYGRGAAVAVVDPWLYNEYTDGRKKIPVNDNYEAGVEFVRWIISLHNGGLSKPKHR
jgi:unsaturated rhamnogalacturonyl hydrolase